jgi:ssDNA-binding Zn-finger/Zn-ribbon topoisomerase 1
MSMEIEPCPFCGGEAFVVKWHNAYIIGCDTPTCYGYINRLDMVFLTKKRAIKTWNRRAKNG